MAYPRYIGKSAFASGTGALTVAALTGTQAGDIIILFAESANQTISTPTGYAVLATQIGTGTAGVAGGVRIATFYRILEDAADTSTTVADSGDHTCAIKMLFRDTSLVNGGFFVASTSTQAATTAMVFPTVTTATDESMVVLGSANDIDAASTTTVGTVTNANLTSITERHDQAVIAGAGGGLAIITGLKATAGATGTSTATASTSVTHAYTTISLSRVAAQTTTSSFNTIDGISYFPISDAMRITAGSTGTVNATSSGTFQPNTLTNGTYSVNFKWYYRQYTTDAWTASTAQAQTVSALVSTGILDTIGEFTDNETVTGLTNGVEYEFVLFAARASATPANTISFTATATVALPATGYTITADAGSYSYTGTAANTLFKRNVVAAPGSYSYTGTASNTLFNRKVVADPGSYSYTGTAANTNFNRKVIADPGSYSYTGTAANFVYNRVIVCDAGSYSYTGTAANLGFGKTITADPGSYSYTGTAANVNYNRKVVVDPGTYTYTGTAANTNFNRKLIAEAGSYTYTGTAATLSKTNKIIADAGSYSYTGTAASTLYSRIMTAAPGSYSYSGTAAALAFGREIAADPGSYSYTGVNANTLFNRRLVADPGSYSYTGTAAFFTSTRRITADPGTYVYTGTAASLERNWSITADPGSYSYSGTAADFVYRYPTTNSDSSLGTTDSTTFVAITDVLKVSTTASAGLTFSGNLTYQPQTMTNGVYYALIIWRYRTVGGAWTDVGTATLSPTPAEVESGILIITGEVEATASLTGLGANTNYEVQLYARRQVSSPTNTLEFSGTAQVDATGNAYSLTANSGSYSYTGAALNLLYSRKIVADPGSYIYTGTAASLERGWSVIAAPGTYAYTGTAATLGFGRKVVAAPGSYTYTGTAANLVYGVSYILAADSGTYSYTGTAATLTYVTGVKKIYLGTGQVANIKLGSNPVISVYHGTTKVFG